MSSKVTILMVLIGAEVLTSCTHPSTPSVFSHPPDSLWIEGPQSVSVDSSVIFTAHRTFDSTPFYSWIFSDSSIRSSDSTIHHSFAQIGQAAFQVKALRQSDSSLFVSANDTVSVHNISLDTSVLTRFHHLVISFEADNQFDPCCPGAMQPEYCGIGGNVFEQTVPVSILNGVAKGSGLTATFSSDALQCDSATCSIGASGSVPYSCGPPSNESASINWNWSETLSLSKLALLYFTPDSICYSVVGPISSSHINFIAGCNTIMPPCGGLSVDDYVAYRGTNWNGTPVPSATVTLYK